MFTAIEPLKMQISIIKIASFWYFVKTDGFLFEEIDMDAFSLLTETDLRSLGVSSYPARKRMLLLIAQLSLQQSEQLWNWTDDNWW